MGRVHSKVGEVVVFGSQKVLVLLSTVVAAVRVVLISSEAFAVTPVMRVGGLSKPSLQ